jgi:hypothetical protein
MLQDKKASVIFTKQNLTLYHDRSVTIQSTATVAGVNVRHQSPYTLRRLILYPIYQALQRYCACHLMSNYQ